MKYAEEDTGLGGKVTRLSFYRTVFAEIHPIRGTEFLEYYRDANALQYKITIRCCAGLTEKDVLVHGSRQFEINSIIDINDENRVMEIYCTERKDKVILSE